MRTVELETLKGDVSDYVRLAASGEIVQVIDRDRVIAEIVPPGAGSPRDANAHRPGTPNAKAANSRTGHAPPRRPIASFETLMRELARDRGDR